MYLGRIVEMADTIDLFTAPRHPYTEALFSAVPQVEAATRRTRIILTGDMPLPVRVTSTACPFARAASTRRPIAPSSYRRCAWSPGAIGRRASATTFNLAPAVERPAQETTADMKAVT